MGLRIELLALILPFICPFLSFMAKFVSQFSMEMCKLEFKYAIHMLNE